jgi:DNA-binding transcriptional MerR regulator
MTKHLDEEWIKLILEAKKLNITIQQIREFLTTNNSNKPL